jgi:hypothetical protein
LLHKGKKMRSGGWSQETDTSKSVPFSKNKLKAAKDLIQQL